MDQLTIEAHVETVGRENINSNVIDEKLKGPMRTKLAELEGKLAELEAEKPK